MAPNTWDCDVTALCNRIIEAVDKRELGTVNQKQCVVLRSLAVCIQDLVKLWVTIRGQESAWNLAAKVGEKLFAVLNNGLRLINLCNEKDIFVVLRIRGQFSEIIDDATRYAEMINSLVLPLAPVSVKNLITKKVGSECKNLPSCLELAIEEDKGALLKFQSGLSGSNIPVSIMQQMLETGFCTSIEDNALSTIKALGSGSFGSVQSAKWYKLPVAVKKFLDEDYFWDELKVFKELLKHANSPHVVQMLGYTDTGEKKLILELMDKDLRTHIMSLESPPPLMQSVDWILQIAKGMSYLHNLKVVHRDLKPANVLVKVQMDESLQVKLTDFGISKDNFQTANTNTEMRGSVMYMAPEMLESTRYYSKAVDIYSFGLICADILTGKLQPEKSMVEIRECRKKGERPTLPQGIPKILQNLVISCLEYNHLKRPHFQYICRELWRVKEEILTGKASSNRVIYCFDVCSKEYSEFPTYYLNDIRLSGVLKVAKYGEISIPDKVRSYLETFKKLLQHEGKNIYLEIGDWDKDRDILSSVYSSGEARNRFVNSIVNMLAEHPIFNGIVIHGKSGKDHIDNLVPFLYNKMKETSALASVKIAIACMAFPNKNWPIDKVIHLVDEIHLVSIRFDSGEWNNTTSHQSNLYPSSLAKATLSIDVAVHMYINREIPASKIFIGAALFAVEFDNTDGMGMSGSRIEKKRQASRPYMELKVSEEKWDDEAKAAYIHHPSGRRVYSYDNDRSMVEKAKYVKENNLGGIVVWNGSYDFRCNDERSVMTAL